jgi:hypothetical protein
VRRGFRHEACYSRLKISSKEVAVSIRRRIQSRLSSPAGFSGTPIGGSIFPGNSDIDRAVLALSAGLLDLAKEVDNLTEEVARLSTKVRRVA